MDSLREQLRLLGPRRLWLIGGATLAVLAALAFAVVGRGPGPMGYLFTDLEPAAAKQVSDRLTQMGVPWQPSADGTAVMVPLDRAAALRMELAGEQLTGKVGYEVLDAESPFGVTDQRARVNLTRAIEGELARSIESLNRVQHARVHIAMPERALFSSQPRPVSAAVALRTTGRLPDASVEAIRALVAASVPELEPARISVIDQHGTLLARAGEEGSAGGIDERQMMIEHRLRDQVEALLERAVGAGRARVEVAALLTRAERRAEAERFDPDGQVIASQTTVESAGEDNEQTGRVAASVANNLAERQQQPVSAAPNDGRRSSNREVSEETRFNSSRTKESTFEQAGRLERLTVSVLVDTKTSTGRTLTPSEIQRLERLMQHAVGFDAQRGDRVVVEAMPLPASDAVAGDAPSGDEFPTWPLFGAGGVVLALVAAYLLQRRRKIQASMNVLPLAAPEQQSDTGTADVGRAIPLDPQRPGLPAPDSTMSVAGVEGHVRSSLVQQIGHAVASNPSEAAALVRQMMTS